MFFYTPWWELTLFRWINQSWRCPFFDVLMPLLSDPLVLWASAIAATLPQLSDKQKMIRCLVWLGITIAASDLTCSFIKDATGRLRPYRALAIRGTMIPAHGPNDRRTIWDQKEGASYPSAHAANAVAAIAIIFLQYRKKALWLVPIAIGYSRLYLGKHFPMDVVAGWGTGLAVAGALILIYPILSRIFSRWMRYRLRT